MLSGEELAQAIPNIRASSKAIPAWDRLNLVMMMPENYNEAMMLRKIAASNFILQNKKVVHVYCMNITHQISSISRFTFAFSNYYSLVLFQTCFYVISILLSSTL